MGSRRGVVALLLALFAVSATTALGATGAATVKSSSNAKLGSILVNARGLTLYRFTKDRNGASACTGGCAAAWPPLLVSGSAKPVAGAGITASKLGTMKRSDGTMQVTYGGAPLYRYAEDTKPGQAKGQGEGGVWFAVSPSGALVKSTKEAAPAASTSSGSSSSSSSGDGSGY